MKEINLNGLWRFAFLDKMRYEDLDETSCICEDWMCVPGCFDAMPEWNYKRGTAIYRRDFTLDTPCRNGLLRIDGMGLRGRFLIDGKKIGSSSLAWSIFELETGAMEAGKHTITAVIDNTLRTDHTELYLPDTDFYGYGGLYHGVSLRTSTQESTLDRVLIRTVDYRIGRISLEFCFLGKTPSSFDAEIYFDTDKETRKLHLDSTVAEFNVPDFRLWSPDDPALHTVTVTIGQETRSEKFGIREIKAEKARLLLNGKDLYLKGFNRHENHLSFGASVPEPLMLADLQHLKQLGCNFVRGAHYPQDQHFLDLCDQMGFLVWEETLGWGIPAPQLADKEFIARQEECVKLMVKYSFNHPSVIIFSFLNELDSHTPEGVAIVERLCTLIRKENSGRLVTFATCHCTTDIANHCTDLIAFNTYPGWIGSSPSLDNLSDRMLSNQNAILAYLRSTFGHDKPIIVSEMGICGIYGQHDDPLVQWTEEFQAEYVEKIIKTVFSEPEIRGLCLWQMNDARSYLRMGGEIRCKPLGQNLAGVYDIYRRPKLAAKIVKKLFNSMNQ